MLDEGCTELVIESRSTEGDVRDRAVILDALRDSGRSGDLVYSWRTKDEPLLWVADAVAGAASEHLTGRPDRWYTPMVHAAALEIRYLPDVRPKVR